MTQYKLKYKRVAIDFDGTISQLKSHPEFGPPLMFAPDVIREIKAHGGEIAIWTCRCDEDESKVKSFLEQHNIPFDYFNEPFPSYLEEFSGNPRKICADIYIDDKSIHSEGIIDWLEINSKLFERI